MYSHRSHNGFTLLEAMLYIALSGTILVAASGVLILMLKTKGRQDAIINVTDEARFLQRTLIQHVQQSRGATFPNVGDVSSSMTLLFDDSDVDPENIFLDDHVLWIQQAGQPRVPLTSAFVSVSEFSVSRISSSSIVDHFYFSLTLTSEQMPYDLFIYTDSIDFTAAQRK
jgi:type II secretory pathway pseudopilin PulG